MKLPGTYESDVVFGESGGAYQPRGKMDKTNVAVPAPLVVWPMTPTESSITHWEMHRKLCRDMMLCHYEAIGHFGFEWGGTMLAKCPDCGQPVSTFITSCPACGTTRFFKKAILRARECPACRGTGTNPDGDLCPDCNQGRQFLNMTMDRRTGQIVAEKWGSDGTYPPEAELIDAIGRQDLAEIRGLLAAGADPNLRVGFGATAMSSAAEHDETGEILRMLVAAGGNINLPDDYGQTPLHSALNSVIDTATQSEREIDWTLVSVVLDLGGDLKLPDTAGRTPLDWVAQRGSATRASFEELLRRRGSEGASRLI